MGLVARAVEEAGIATVCVSTARDITALVKPPRSLFVNFPMGNSFGRPGDRARQTQIPRDALDLVVSARKPGRLVELPYEWGEDFVFYAGDTGPEALRRQLQK